MAESVFELTSIFVGPCVSKSDTKLSIKRLVVSLKRSRKIGKQNRKFFKEVV